MERISLERIYRKYMLGSYQWNASRFEVFNLLKQKDLELSHYFDNLASLGFIEVRYTRSSCYPHYRVFRIDLLFLSSLDFDNLNFSDSFIDDVVNRINVFLGHEK